MRRSGRSRTRSSARSSSCSRTAGRTLFRGSRASARTSPWAFDEGFGTLWGCEDLEFGFRAVAAGADAAVVAGARGWHLTHPKPDAVEHDATLRRFVSLHPVPEVKALALLLRPGASAESYVELVRGLASRAGRY
jgi:hypothetical protein